MQMTLPYQPHSRTSKRAAESAASKAPTDRIRVLEYLKSCGEDGATDQEIQNALSLKESTERPRRVSLVQSGEVVDSGKTRLTEAGKQAVVWKVK